MYVDLAGLARYKQDLDAWARGALLPKDAAAARVRTAKAGAVSFVPVQETPLDVSVDFLFSETSPASGDKGPSNPSTITGVSSVKVTRCGRNLALNRSTAASNGVTCTANGDGTYTVNGQATGGMAQFPLITAYSKLPIATGDWATVSGCPSGGAVSTYSTYLELRDKNAVWKASRYDTGGVPFPFEATEDGYLTYSILLKEGTSVSNLLFKPQMEFGTVATEFEKPEYNEYTIPLGSTYYGGTLDVASGVMTVTHYGIVLNGTENWGGFGPGGVAGYNRMILSGVVPFIKTPAADHCTSTHYIINGTNAYNGPCATVYNSGTAFGQLYLWDVYESLSDFTNFLATQYASGTPVTVCYELLNPQTVQLTPTEILSLTQSSDYDPRVNTVYTDASAVQVGYLKHPSAASADLRNAVVSLGGGV